MISDPFVAHLAKKHSSPAYIDSVGSGSIFGEIVACAVAIPVPFHNSEVDDSKKLKHETIYRLAPELRSKVLFGIGMSSPAEIKKFRSTFRADKLAMARAVKNLGVSVDALFIDGDSKYALGTCPTEYTVVKGDAKVFGIAVASIIAKDFRDHLMIEMYGKDFSRYCISQNKGYRSPDHLMAIRKWGITEYHRDYMSQIQFVLSGGYDKIISSKWRDNG